MRLSNDGTLEIGDPMDGGEELISRDEAELFAAQVLELAKQMPTEAEVNAAAGVQAFARMFGPGGIWGWTRVWPRIVPDYDDVVALFGVSRISYPVRLSGVARLLNKPLDEQDLPGPGEHIEWIKGAG